jgi:hypothetical protein
MTFQVRDGQGATDNQALTLQVVAQSSGGLHPHEPAGFTPLYDNPGTFLLSSSTAVWNTNSYNALAQIVSDPSNPTGSGQAIRRTHPSGGGAGAAKLESWSDLGTTLGGQGYSGGGMQELYVSHRRKVPAGEAGCATNVGGNGFKFFYFGTHRDAKQGDGANEIYSTGCVNEGLTVQSGGGGDTQDFFRDLQWPPPADVTWHIEYHFIAESSNGAGDGEAYIYVNGSLIQGGHITGISYSDPTQAGRLLDGMEMYHTQHALVSGASHSWLEQEWYVSGR